MLSSATKHVFVTGGNAGIGQACCKLLATEHGCQVYMGSRSVEKGKAALSTIRRRARGSP